MTKDEWTERVRAYAKYYAEKETVRRVAQAIKRKDPITRMRTAQFKATERYSIGWTDPRGVYGTVK